MGQAGEVSGPFRQERWQARRDQPGPERLVGSSDLGWGRVGDGPPRVAQGCDPRRGEPFQLDERH